MPQEQMTFGNAAATAANGFTANQGATPGAMPATATMPAAAATTAPVAPDAQMLTVLSDGKIMLNIELLAKLPSKSQFGEKFAEGETLAINPTDQTQSFKGQEIPVLNVGGRMVRLDNLLGFKLFTQEFAAAIRNAGTPDECLDRDYRGQTLRDMIKQSNGVMPSSLVVRKRIKSGAKQDYLAKDTEAKTTAYVHKGHNTNLPDFPYIFVRGNKDKSVPDNWRYAESIIVEPVF